MLEKGKISSRQFTLLVTFFTIGSAILIIPSAIASKAKEDTWIAGLLGLGVGLLLVLCYSHISYRYPKLNFAEIIEVILGKKVGRIVSFLYFFTFVFFVAILVLRDIGDFMLTVMTGETPIEAIHFLFLAVVIFGVRLGVETFSRTMELFLPGVLILFIFLIVAISPQIDISNVLPILDNGIVPVIQSSFTFIAFPFLELMIFLMIIPYVNRPERTRKPFLLGTFIGGAVLVLISSLSILVIGVEETTRSIYSSYDLSKTINIGHFFQRVEAMMAFIWFVTVFVKLIIYTYTSCIGLAHSLRLHDYKVLTFPLGLLLFIMSIVIFPNSSSLIEFTPIFTTYAILWGFVFPVVLLLIGMLRRKRSS